MKEKNTATNSSVARTPLGSSIVNRFFSLFSLKKLSPEAVFEKIYSKHSLYVETSEDGDAYLIINLVRDNKNKWVFTAIDEEGETFILAQEDFIEEVPDFKITQASNSNASEQWKISIFNFLSQYQFYSLRENRQINRWGEGFERLHKLEQFLIKQEQIIEKDEAIYFLPDSYCQLSPEHKPLKAESAFMNTLANMTNNFQDDYTLPSDAHMKPSHAPKSFLEPIIFEGKYRQEKLRLFLQQAYAYGDIPGETHTIRNLLLSYLQLTSFLLPNPYLQLQNPRQPWKPGASSQTETNNGLQLLSSEVDQKSLFSPASLSSNSSYAIPPRATAELYQQLACTSGLVLGAINALWFENPLFLSMGLACQSSVEAAAPMVANPIPNQTARLNTPFSLILDPDQIFSDADGDSLRFTEVRLVGGSALPAWLTLKHLPTLKGSYNTPGTAYSVAVSGNYAYVADDTGGLRIINISNPASPTSVGVYDTPGNARSVAISGNYAYVADDTGGLRIINISNPASPISVNIHDTPGNARGIAISGSYAYVADGTAGLQIININNPSSLSLVSTYNTPGSAQGVAISGNYAYVADDNAGLQVIDISNPASPSLIGTHNSLGTTYGVAISANYAYVADASAGLQIININNPANPSLVGTYDSPGTAFGVAILGKHAYVADGAAGVQIIDISNPNSPSLVGSYDSSGTAYGIATLGNYAYVADASSGLRVIDISNWELKGTPKAGDTINLAIEVIGSDSINSVSDSFQITNTAPVVVNPIADQTASTNVPFNFLLDPAQIFSDAEGDAVSIAQIRQVGGAALPTWLTIEHTLTLAGSYATSGTASGVAVSGNYAYVTDGILKIINISNPLSPSFVSFYDTHGGANGVAISGNYVYLTVNTAGLYIIDVSNPASPSLIGTCTTGIASGVAISGNYAYVNGDSAGLHIISISNPASPSLVKTYDTSGIVKDTAISGNYAYVADDYGGFRIINISNPASPSQIGIYSMPFCVDVAISGNYAYVADYNLGLCIFNISNPANPSLVSTVSGSAHSVKISGNYAYVDIGTNIGLQVIDISNPASPSLVGNLDTTTSGITNAYDITILDNYAYVATNAGLKIINISRRTLKGTPMTGDTVSLTLEVVVSDDVNTASDVFKINSTAPTVNNPIPDQIANINVPFSLTLNPAQIFSDAQGDILSIAQVRQVGGAALPAWLTLEHSFTLVGSLATSRGSFDVEVSGNYAYMVEPITGIRIINIADRANPSLLLTFDTPGAPRDIEISGNYAYLADSGSGLKVIDISNPTSPSVVGTYPHSHIMESVAISGNYAYAANFQSGLRVIDISNPASPNLVRTFAPSGAVTHVEVSANFAYVFVADFFSVNDIEGLYILNITNPAIPTLLSIYQGPFFGIAVSGNYAYLPLGNPGLRIINISNPASPSLVGTYNTSGYAEHITIVGNYAYVANGNSGLLVLDISNPASPKVAGTYATSAYARRFTIKDNFAYVLEIDTGTNLKILDISSRKLTGTPTSSDIANLNLEVIGSDGKETVSDIFQLTVSSGLTATNLNQALSYTEDTTKALLPLSVTSPQASTITVSLTLSNPSAGSLNTATSGSVTSTYNAATGLWQATGAKANVNALLAALSFSPASHFNGNFTITTSVADNINTPLSGSIAMTGIAVNDLPTVANAIADQTALVGMPFSLALNPTQLFNDIDGDTLSITQIRQANGAALPSWLAIGVSNQSLSGTPSANDGNLSIEVTGSDGIGTVSDLFLLTINPSLTATNLNQTLSYTEDTTKALLPLSVTSLPASTISVTLTLSNPAAGSLNTATSGSVASTYNATTGLWQANGAKTNVNALLASLSFVPAVNYNGNFTIATYVADNINTPLSGSIAMTGIGVNDLPTVANAIADQTALVGMPFSLTLNATQIFNDIDGDTLSITQIRQASGAALPAWLSVGASNQSLSGTPNANDGNLSIEVTGSDGIGTVSDLFLLTINPSLTATNLNQTLSYTEDTAKTLLPVSVTSLPASTINVTLTLSNPAAGSLNTATSGSVTSTYNATTGLWQATGAKTNVNALLASLSFVPAVNYNGNFTIATSVADNINAPLSGSIAMTGTAVNDLPTVVNAIADQTALVGMPFSLILNPANIFNDIDGDVLNITQIRQASGAALPSWLAIGASNQSLLGTPSANDGNLSIEITGSDGVGTVSDTFLLTINPSLTTANLNQTLSYTEDTTKALLPLSVTSLPASTISVSLTLSNPAAGSLNTATSGSVTSTYNAVTGLWQATGAKANVNTLLAALSFSPASHFNGNFTIATSVADNINAPLSGSIAMTGIAVNDLPTVANAIADQTALVGMPFSLILNPANIFNDVDGDTLSITQIRQSNGAALPSWLAIGVSNQSLSGTPSANDSNLSIEITGSDGVGTVSDLFLLTINPSLTATNLNQTLSYTEDTTKALLPLSVTSLPASTISVTLTLSNPAAGKLATATAGTVSSSYNASTGIWQANGAKADVNALTMNLQFIPSPDFNSNFTISTQVMDNINVPLSSTITMSGIAVNDSPVLNGTIGVLIFPMDKPFSYLVPHDIITDIDSTLVYQIQNRPSWVHFNSTSLLISGQPSEFVPKLMHLTLTASDQDYSVGCPFKLKFIDASASAVREYPVSSEKEFNHHSPAALAFDNGNYVVSWQRDNSTSSDILAQPYLVNGMKLGDTIQVANSQNSIRYIIPSIAKYKNRNFAIAFIQQNYANNSSVIVLQKYTENGMPIANKNTLLSLPFQPEIIAKILISDDDRLLMLYSYKASIDGYRLFQRLFTSDLASSLETELTDIAEKQLIRFNCNLLPPENYVLAWEKHIDNIPFLVINNYQFTGALNSTFPLYDLALSGSTQFPSIIANNRGEYAVSAHGTNNRKVGNFVQIFNASNIPLWNDFLAFTLKSSSQTAAIWHKDDLIISWHDNISNANRLSIFNIRCNEKGKVSSSRLRVSKSDHLIHQRPIAVSLNDLVFVNFWESINTDSNLSTIMMRLIGEPPKLLNPISKQANHDAYIGTAYSFTFAQNTFLVQPGEALTFYAKLTNGNQLPAWINFDANTRTFSGIPQSGNEGNLQIELFADNGAGVISDFLKMNVLPSLVLDLAEEVFNYNHPHFFATLNMTSYTSNQPVSLSFALPQNVNISLSTPANTLLPIYNSTAQLWQFTGNATSINAVLQQLKFLADGNLKGDYESVILIEDGINTPIRKKLFLVDNRAPIFKKPNPTISAKIGMPINTSFSELASVFDADGDILDYAVNEGLPFGMTFNNKSGMIMGTPILVPPQKISYNISVSDHRKAAETKLNINLIGTLFAANHQQQAVYIEGRATTLEPVVLISELTLPIQVNISLGQSAAGSLSLPKNNSAISISHNEQETNWHLTGLAKEISNSFHITYKPAAHYNKEVTISIGIDDGANLPIYSQINLRGIPVNNPPLLNKKLKTLMLKVEAMLKVSLAHDTFIDPDGDNLSYSARLVNGNSLPDWLEFYPKSLEFIITPSTAIGTFSIEVIATDDLAQASDVFDLILQEVNKEGIDDINSFDWLPYVIATLAIIVLASSCCGMYLWHSGKKKNEEIDNEHDAVHLERLKQHLADLKSKSNELQKLLSIHQKNSLHEPLPSSNTIEIAENIREKEKLISKTDEPNEGTKQKIFEILTPSSSSETGQENPLYNLPKVRNGNFFSPAASSIRESAIPLAKVQPNSSIALQEERSSPIQLKPLLIETPEQRSQNPLTLFFSSNPQKLQKFINAKESLKQ